jgi:hypothetical protein
VINATSGTVNGVSVGGTTQAAGAFTTLGVGISAPAAGFPAEVNAGALAGMLFQTNDGSDDAPNLYFHGTGRYLSMDEDGDQYRFISEIRPGVGGYVMMEMDGSSASGPGVATFEGPVNATAGITAGTYMGPATAPTGSCSTNGAWVFSQDGHATFCANGTWVTKI